MIRRALLLASIVVFGACFWAVTGWFAVIDLWVVSLAIVVAPFAGLAVVHLATSIARRPRPRGSAR